MDFEAADDELGAPDPAGPGPGAARYPHRERDAGWVVAAVSGDPAAFGRLYDAWFDKAYDVALRIGRDREVAAEVTQDAFLSAWRNLGRLEDPGAFGGWLLRIARNGAYNRQRKEQRSQPVDDRGLAVIEAVGASPSSAPQGFGVEDRLSAASDPSRAMEDAELADLVWDAAEALGQRDAEVLDLQLRHGLSPAEIGEVIGLNRNAANQLVHRVRGRLDAAIRARVLWRGGAPVCADLQRLLQSAGVERFDAEAVKLSDTHAKTCETCAERRELRLKPAALFASVPVAAAPVFLKTQAASALEALGVPMQGSAYAGGGAAGAGAGAGEVAGADAGLGGSAGGAASGATVEGADVVPIDAARSAGRSWRVAALTAAAVVVVVALLFGISGRLGPGLSEEQVASSGPTGSAAPGTDPTSTTATPPSTAATGTSLPGGPTTTVSGPLPTVVTGDPGPTSPPTTVAATSPSTTAAPTTPSTTAPPTIPPKIAVAIDGQSSVTRTTAWSMLRGAPVLTWTAPDVPQGGRVEVRGAGPGKATPVTSVLSTSLTTDPAGGQRLCPGTAGTSSVCNAFNGVWDYTVEVFDGGGKSLGAASARLVVRIPVIG